MSTWQQGAGGACSQSALDIPEAVGNHGLRHRAPLTERRGFWIRFRPKNICINSTQARAGPGTVQIASLMSLRSVAALSVSHCVQ
jgi:hypothetical protein